MILTIFTLCFSITINNPTLASRVRINVYKKLINELIYYIYTDVF